MNKLLSGLTIKCNNKKMLLRTRAMLKYWGYSFMVKGLQIFVK